MNRWRWILVVTIAIFAVRAGFFPDERWWAIWGIIMVVGGVGLRYHEYIRERQAAEAMEEYGSCWQFYLGLVASFLGGVGLAAYHKLGFWPVLGIGVLSLMVYFFAFLFTVVGGDDGKSEDWA